MDESLTVPKPPGQEDGFVCTTNEDANDEVRSINNYVRLLFTNTHNRMTPSLNTRMSLAELVLRAGQKFHGIYYRQSTRTIPPRRT